MNITVTVEFPDNLVIEAMPVFCQEKSLDVEGKTQEEVIELVAQAIADEQKDRFKELLQRKRSKEAIEKLDAEMTA